MLPHSHPSIRDFASMHIGEYPLLHRLKKIRQKNLFRKHIFFIPYCNPDRNVI